MVDLDPIVERIAAQVAAIGGVTAVALGGSRARGDHRADSDWDLGVFYRGALDTNAIRALRYSGQIFEPHQWGPVINGGAWLDIEGRRVDLVYQDLDEVERWTADCEAGTFEIHRLVGYAAGIPTYNAVGALAEAVVLHGTLPRPTFPDALRETAPPIWRNLAAGALATAAVHARRRELATCIVELGLAALSEAHARCCARGEWVLSEKGLLERAGLTSINRLIDGPERLLTRVQLVREHLALEVAWGPSD